jgi:uncharacterized protein (TIGR02646 family)
MLDGSTHVVKAQYKPYRLAKGPLCMNFGEYCSYCEHPIDYRDLEVEHIQAQSLYPQRIPDWDNFLLSCSTCNGNDNKSNKDVVIGHCHLPHLNNTFLSLRYLDGGVVIVNPALTGQSKINAENLLELVGLDKSPAEAESDKRWHYRQETWNLATRYLNKYINGEVSVDVIIDLAKAEGHWSIWFTVFANHDQVLEKLISDFPGTAADCFDANNHYRPIERNPSNINDPV